MTSAITNGPTLAWAQPSNGTFQQSGEWTASGIPSVNVPDGTTTAVFATGSPTPYTVTGAGQAAQLQVIGDHVTLTGGYLGLSGAADPLSPGAVSDLVIDSGASLLVAAGEQLGGSDGVVIGESGTGTLIVIGILSDGSGTLEAGTVTVAGTNAAWRSALALSIAGGTVSVQAKGVLAASGSLTVGAGGTLAFDDTAQIEANTIDLTGGVLTLTGTAGSAPLALSSAILLAAGSGNTISVAAGDTLINYGSFGALGTAAGALTLDGGGTLELYRAGQFAAFDVVGSTAMLEAPGAGLVTAGAGAISLDSSARLVVGDGTGGVAVTASSGSDTVSVGAADSVAFGGTAPLTFLTGGGQAVIEASGGAATRVLVQAGTASGQVVFVNGLGASTLFGGQGSDTVFAGGGGYYVGGSAGNNGLVASNAAVTLVGGGSNDALYGSPGSSGAALLYGGAGSESLVGGAGADTLVGGTGTTVMFAGLNRSTIIGGSGADSMGGRGQDVIYGGSGAAVMFGGAGSDTMIAGTGNTTMVGGSGTALMTGGAGSNVFVGTGSGTAYVFAGSGNEVTFTGSGTMSLVEGSGSSTVQFQSGTAAVFGGAGPALYDWVNGQAGGTDFISGYRPGIDQVAFFGYGAPAIAHQAVSGGSLQVVLSDGTNVQFQGLTTLLPPQ